jgi:type IV pilus assembly protein PilF
MNTLRLTWLSSVVVMLSACASSGSVGERSSDTDAAVANMNLGAGYLRQGNIELAIERLQRALAQNPRLADAHSTIAVAYNQIGSLADAEEHYRRATQLESNNGGAANSYAVFLCQQNRWTDAEPYFRRAVDSSSYATPEVALTNAGVCARTAGVLDKAEENFRAALTRNPNFADALVNMIELSYDSGNFMQARAFVQRFLDAKPPTAPVLWLCFNIERELKNAPGADRCAAQLRSGFRGSPELAQLDDQQRSNGR